MLSTSKVNFERYFEPVFQPVSFDLEAGQLLLITGTNGCGKTTLIRVLAGVLHPTSGRIDMRASTMAYVGHYLALKDDLSVFENLRFMRDFIGTSQRDVDAVIEEVGLGHVKYNQARHLSAGQRKRCALARLLLSEAQLWLLDEPYSNLDIEGVGLVDRLLTQHLETGGSAAVATHGAHRPAWAGTVDYELLSGRAA
ncbi:MAG: heme ABC exporter ATP-binding protein CcmA [Gammaproteobacteria bacterium]|nr:heme ABC exporter ATP-binding protein CcmA [Gammaproteobacteria bacterium]